MDQLISSKSKRERWICPNHHTEIEHGEHKNKILYAIWQRLYVDGTLGELKTSKIRGSVTN